MGGFHGLNGIIYISGAAIAAANSWSINIDTDSVEIPQFGDTYKKRVVGLGDWSGSVSAWDDLTVKTLQDAATAQATVALIVYPLRTDLTNYYSGSAIFSFGSEGDTGSAVGDTADFVGDDTLTITGWS